MINERNIVFHELIGLKVRILKSKVKGYKNIKGKIIDETKNTFLIEKENGKRVRIIKNVCTFVFYLNGKKVKVDGRLLVGNPEDRIKKRIPNWKMSEIC